MGCKPVRRPATSRSYSTAQLLYSRNFFILDAYLENACSLMRGQSWKMNMMRLERALALSKTSKVFDLSPSLWS
jgi:hypothetical protein